MGQRNTNTGGKKKKRNTTRVGQCTGTSCNPRGKLHFRRKIKHRKSRKKRRFVTVRSDARPKREVKLHCERLMREHVVQEEQCSCMQSRSVQCTVSTTAEDNGLLHWRDQSESAPVGLIISRPIHIPSPFSLSYANITLAVTPCCRIISALWA